MVRLRRWGRWTAAAGLLGLVAAAGLVWLRVRLALPQVEGEVHAGGLSAPVEIVRDTDGVPHIRASSEADALFALGYVHAQDRLWQMEFQRRLAAGRLSEVVGPEGLPADRLMRTLEISRVARATVSRLEPGPRRLLEAYTAGVNAVLQAGRPRPIEFAILGVEPEPWRPEDAVAWSKVMALGLATNWRDELLRLRIRARVGADGDEALMPPYTEGDPVILPEAPTGAGAMGAARRRPLAGCGGSVGPALAGSGAARGGPVDASAGVVHGGAAGGPRTLAGSRQLAGGVSRASGCEAPGQASALPPSRGPAAVDRPAVTLPASLAGRIAMLDVLDPSGGGFVPALAASNSWTVAGHRSATGRPLLANDPHLAARLPSTWYLAHVQGGRLDVIGATLPGVPAVIIGHNRRIAWGLTNLMADVQDLFIERVNARQEVEFRGAWEPLRIVHEVIRVKGHPDERLAVRASRHGPIVSDVAVGATEALALRWTALDEDEGTFQAFLGVNLAGSWEEFTRALEEYGSPVQNFVYADVEGHIGYLAPGRIPVRARGDGTVPVPGWTGEYEWTGFLPPERWPRAFDPARGFIASANNPVWSDAGRPLLSTNWEPGYRAARIVELLESLPAATIEAMARMQADVATPQVRVLLPWMRQARPRGAAARAALGRLAGWDGALAGESAEAAIFMTWLSRTTERIFADELGRDLWDEYRQWPHWQAKALDRLARTGDDRWCDDVRTGEREDCAAILGLALEEGLADLAARQGSDAARWRWDRENVIVFPHAPFEGVWGLRAFFSRRVRAGGSATTLSPVMRIQDQIVISSYRQIVDLGDLERSRFVHPLGQSGQPGGTHFLDLLDAWRSGRYVPMRFSREAVDAAAASRLRLLPD
jgi:acyl-homoserine lactone acylase PvdQ